MASGIGSLYGMSQDLHNQLLVGWCLVHVIYSDAATIRQDAAAEAAMAYRMETPGLNVKCNPATHEYSPATSCSSSSSSCRYKVQCWLR